MHLNAEPQAVGHARVRKPFDAALDEIAQQVAQPQLVIVTSQEKVDQIVHRPSRGCCTPSSGRSAEASSR
jgi:hypothetical protein